MAAFYCHRLVWYCHRVYYIASGVYCTATGLSTVRFHLPHTKLQLLFETFGSYLHMARANAAAHAKPRAEILPGTPPHSPGVTGNLPGTPDDAAPAQAPPSTPAL